MILRQANPLIRWYTSATLFILLCIFIDRPQNLKCSFTFKTPKISFTEIIVVLQQLSWAKRYFLTDEHHHLVNRKHIPSAHSRLFVNGACQQTSRRGIRAPLLFLRNKVYWIYQNNAHTIANYRKPLWSWMHHEEGIPHLTLGQLKPQLGLIKERRRGASLPRWKLADGTGLLLTAAAKTISELVCSSVFERGRRYL